MKLNYINPHHVRHLVPSWVIDPFHLAKSLDGMLAVYFSGKGRPDPHSALSFWVEMVRQGDGFSTRLCEPTSAEELSYCGSLIIDSVDTGLRLPLNAMLIGHDPLVGSHCVYYHSIGTDLPLAYIGVTKRTWFERLREHQSAAAKGSNLLFHRALREHVGKKLTHWVLLAGVNYDTAMHYEEEFVGLRSLYPLGLNMIPGGLAGLRYLHTFGVHASTPEQREDALQRIVERDSIDGRPNPLCAARWEVDQDFVNRVICGHSGRLTVEQVRLIRMLSASGKPKKSVADYVKASVEKVGDVLAGRVYSRVA